MVVLGFCETNILVCIYRKNDDMLVTGFFLVRNGATEEEQCQRCRSIVDVTYLRHHVCRKSHHSVLALGVLNAFFSQTSGHVFLKNLESVDMGKKKTQGTPPDFVSSGQYGVETRGQGVLLTVCDPNVCFSDRCSAVNDWLGTE